MSRSLARALLVRELASRAPAPKPGGSRSVLLIRPDHLGDLLFTTPALRRFRAALPGWRIAAAVGPWSAAVLRQNPDVDELIELPFPGFTRAAKRGLLAPYQLALAEAHLLSGRDFAAAVVLRDDHWWGALLAMLAGIPRRIGSTDAALAGLLTTPVRVAGHSVVRNAALLDAAARELGGSPPSEPPAPATDPLFWDVTELDRVAARSSAGPGSFVAIHPGSGAPVKSWPSERWSVLADRVASSGRRIVLTGGESERGLTAAIAGSMTSEAVNLSGLTSLHRLGGVFAEAELVLGVDSGPLHLAVATGTSTVQLYGPSDLAKFGPWGDPARHRVVRSGLHCDRCGDLSPTRPAGTGCMVAIGEAMVWDQVRYLLERPVHA